MAQQAQQTKKGKKKWYTVFASDLFNKAVLGEVLAYSSESLIGRSLWVNLSQLNRDMRSQHIRIRFKIKEVKGDKAETEIVGYDVVGTFIKRIVRSTKDKIDDSFAAETKEKIKLRVKTIYLTRNNTQRSRSTNIKKQAREEIQALLKDMSYDDFIFNVSTNKIQRTLKTTLSKIYPLQSVEVRAIERLA